MNREAVEERVTQTVKRCRFTSDFSYPLKGMQQRLRHVTDHLNCKNRFGTRRHSTFLKGVPELHGAQPVKVRTVVQKIVPTGQNPFERIDTYLLWKIREFMVHREGDAVTLLVPLMLLCKGMAAYISSNKVLHKLVAEDVFCFTYLQSQTFAARQCSTFRDLLDHRDSLDGSELDLFCPQFRWQHLRNGRLRVQSQHTPFLLYERFDTVEHRDGFLRAVARPGQAERIQTLLEGFLEGNLAVEMGILFPAERAYPIHWPTPSRAEILLRQRSLHRRVAGCSIYCGISIGYSLRNCRFTFSLHIQKLISVSSLG